MIFTPGPWRVSSATLGQKLLIETGDENTLSPIIGSVYSDEGSLPLKANASLIAAAPDMHTVCELVVNVFSDATPPAERVAKMELALELAKAALAKVQG